MASLSSKHQCCATIVPLLPPHRHRAVATAGPRPHGHLEQHTSVLWHHRCLLPPHRHRAVATAGPRPHGHLEQHTSVLWYHRCFAAATSAPCCSNSWAMASWPPLAAAIINAVKPSLLAAATSAPCCSNSWATASWPPPAACTSMLWSPSLCCRHIGTVL